MFGASQVDDRRTIFMKSVGSSRRCQRMSASSKTFSLAAVCRESLVDPLCDGSSQRSVFAPHLD